MPKESLGDIQEKPASEQQEKIAEEEKIASEQPAKVTDEEKSALENK